MWADKNHRVRKVRHRASTSEKAIVSGLSLGISSDTPYDVQSCSDILNGDPVVVFKLI